MEKKEAYRHALPHFQQSGQAYFVTWCLKDAVPPKALEYYTKLLNSLQCQIEDAVRRKAEQQLIDDLKTEYYFTRKKYIKAFDDLLHLQHTSIVNLSAPENLAVMREALLFWEGKKLYNYAFCVMCNHVHWVFHTFNEDSEGKPVYLQDILHSVKRFSANKINKLENRSGALWQKESFDTTIRDEKHLYNAIEYTLNNPVAANLIQNREEWQGSWW